MDDLFARGKHNQVVEFLFSDHAYLHVLRYVCVCGCVECCLCYACCGFVLFVCLCLCGAASCGFAVCCVVSDITCTFLWDFRPSCHDMLFVRFFNANTTTDSKVLSHTGHDGPDVGPCWLVSGLSILPQDKWEAAKWSICKERT